MKRKGPGLLAWLIAATLLLGACGGPTATPQPTAPPTATAQPTVPPTAALAALILAPEEVQATAPCTNEILIYDPMDEQDLTAEDMAGWQVLPALLRAHAGGVIPSNDSETDPHEVGIMIQVIFAYPDVRSAEQQMEAWRPFDYVATIYQQTEAPAGYFRQEVPVQGIGDEAIAHTYTNAAGFAGPTSDLLLRQGTLVVLLYGGPSTTEECIPPFDLSMLEPLARAVVQRMEATP